MTNFDLEKITQLPELKGEFFLTPKEFAKIAGITPECVYGWGRAGYIKLKRFSPRRLMVPKSEVLRYLKGEMMETKK
ncbi:MAG: helix-turn-helix domain-containing protein [Treponema sp.]|jgi:predicted site-specific integrase-resolvase|nr:helix-turn-helix domain-containing protein [Treponema sp.]